MRIFLALIAVALVTAGALAQGVGKGRYKSDTAKTENSAKKKAAEEAYKKSLKSIPDSKQKLDPWKDVR
jgi:hypothetical protein